MQETYDFEVQTSVKVAEIQSALEKSLASVEIPPIRQGLVPTFSDIAYLENLVADVTAAKSKVRKTYHTAVDNRNRQFFDDLNHVLGILVIPIYDWEDRDDMPEIIANGVPGEISEEGPFKELDAMAVAALPPYTHVSLPVMIELQKQCQIDTYTIIEKTSVVAKKLDDVQRWACERLATLTEADSIYVNERKSKGQMRNYIGYVFDDDEMIVGMCDLAREHAAYSRKRFPLSLRFVAHFTPEMIHEQMKDGRDFEVLDGGVAVYRLSNPSNVLPKEIIIKHFVESKLAEQGHEYARRQPFTTAAVRIGDTLRSALNYVMPAAKSDAEDSNPEIEIIELEI